MGCLLKLKPEATPTKGSRPIVLSNNVYSVKNLYKCWDKIIVWWGKGGGNKGPIPPPQNETPVKVRNLLLGLLDWSYNVQQQLHVKKHILTDPLCDHTIVLQLVKGQPKVYLWYRRSIVGLKSCLFTTASLICMSQTVKYVLSRWNENRQTQTLCPHTHSPRVKNAYIACHV